MAASTAVSQPLLEALVKGVRAIPTAAREMAPEEKKFKDWRYYA